MDTDYEKIRGIFIEFLNENSTRHEGNLYEFCGHPLGKKEIDKLLAELDAARGPEGELEGLQRSLLGHSLVVTSVGRKLEETTEAVKILAFVSVLEQIDNSSQMRGALERYDKLPSGLRSDPCRIKALRDELTERARMLEKIKARLEASLGLSEEGVRESEEGADE